MRRRKFITYAVKNSWWERIIRRLKGWRCGKWHYEGYYIYF